MTNAVYLFSAYYLPRMIRTADRGAYFRATVIQYLLLIGAFVVTLIASASVKSAMNRYSRVPASRGVNGLQTAVTLLQNKGIFGVTVEPGSGYGTDHYNPSSKKVVLGQESYSQASVTAVAVAAHECGHAMQDAENYLPLKIRTSIVPVTNVANFLSWPLIIIGLLFSLPKITTIGVIVFSAVVVFQLVTLPVEFNASSRAIRAIQENGLLTQDELPGAKKVLTAAAMTYVAALASSVMTLIRLLLLTSGRRRD